MKFRKFFVIAVLAVLVVATGTLYFFFSQLKENTSSLVSALLDKWKFFLVLGPALLVLAACYSLERSLSIKYSIYIFNIIFFLQFLLFTLLYESVVTLSIGQNNWWWVASTIFGFLTPVFVIERNIVQEQDS